MKETDVIVVGAGLAGLCAAIHLQEKGYSVRVVEGEDRAGGRVKTDVVEGFLLDRGFQVLLTAYPETQKMLDYAALDLRTFEPGALVLNGRGIHRIGDPLRQFSMLLPTIFSGVGSLWDKLNVLRLQMRLKAMSLPDLFAQEEIPTSEALKSYGLGPGIMKDFFVPFFRGIFLEKDLRTSRRMFDFVFKMFAEGDAAVPAKGMETIARQLADRVGQENFLFNTRVEAVEKGIVQLQGGERLQARAIILATEGNNTLIQPYQDPNPTPASPRSVTCVYLSADRAPFEGPVLALKSSPEGWVNNVSVMSEVSPHYAPEGKALISVSMIGVFPEGDELLTEAIRSELQPWFGEQVKSWRHLRTYRIAYALPGNGSVKDAQASKVKEGIYLAGDHLLNGSINAAMKSGRLAAEAVAADIPARLSDDL